MSNLRLLIALLMTAALVAPGCGDSERDTVTDAERENNEAAAIATLLTINSSQRQLVDDVLIDCDADGLGEFGTIKELTGTFGLRLFQSKEQDVETGTPYSNFSKRSAPISPAILDPSLGTLDREGILVKSGYCFRLYLPDNSEPPRFVHEVQERHLVALKGGSLQIGTDAAELYWCAYAWPEKADVTGDRVFFINEDGQVMQSLNKVAKWSGKSKAPAGNSAYTSSSIAADVADLEKGRDGDRWKAVR